MTIGFNGNAWRTVSIANENLSQVFPFRLPTHDVPLFDSSYILTCAMIPLQCYILVCVIRRLEYIT